MINPLIIGSFVAVVAIVGLLAFVFRDSGTSKTATRLDILVGKRRHDSSHDLLLRKSAFDGDAKTVLEMIAAKIPNLQKFFEQADAHIKPSSLVFLGGVFGLIGITGSWLAGVPAFFMPLPGLVLFLAPFGWLWNKRRARLKSFAAQLPDAMELVARALRAGHALGAGMHVVAEEMPSPIADEFGRVYEEQNLGIALEDALRGMCERVPNLDLRFFVTSVAIQRQTGGDLAEILDKIGYVIRERYRIMGQVKALTAEGRLSGVVLIALPFLLFLVMLHIKPDYVKALWETKEGIKMSVFALIMQVVGALVIKKIVDIKV
ncbi:MAG TPA: type II secretion system F family protein [Gemmataceae bacterium]|jgi:tight adherence protein B|nr:type II secretion system F family protein [Gemmataceae bacterium]